MQLSQLGKLGVSLVILSTLAGCAGKGVNSFCEIYEPIKNDDGSCSPQMEEQIDYNESPYYADCTSNKSIWNL